MKYPIRSLTSVAACAAILACSHAPQPVPAGSPSMPQASGGADPHAGMASDPHAGMAFVSPSFDAQPGWVEETPSSGMRKKQFRLPGEGDAEDAELAVFHFPGSGGDAESNIARWCGQFAPIDGRPAREAAEVTTEDRDGMRLTFVDLTGRYVAETTPGSGVRVDKPDTRLLAAVIECSGGPYFVKLVGPADTVEHWKASYQSFLADLR